MKMLLFSDVHLNKVYCERLCTLSEEVDVVVGAGDFGSIRRGTDECISWLSKINKPSVLVPGNAESFEELEDACCQWPMARVLHGSQTEIEGITFFGIGGGIPITPFGSWSYDFTEPEAANLLEKCSKGAVLISHSPPFGLLDVSSHGQHLGTTSVRQAVEEKSPILVVCGHIHESSGKITKLKGIDIVNAGPKGYLYELSIPTG